MPVLVAAEHFEIPERVKTKIEKSMSALEKFVPIGSIVRVFLKRGPRHGYEATVTVNGLRESLAYTESRDDLMELVSSLKSHMKRQLIAERKKRLAGRHREKRAPLPSSG